MIFRLIVTLILVPLILLCLLLALGAFSEGAGGSVIFFVILAMVGCVLLREVWEWHPMSGWWL